MPKKNKHFLTITFLMIIFLSSCTLGARRESQNTASSTSELESPTRSDPNLSYPINPSYPVEDNSSSYPVNEHNPNYQPGPEFRIDEPVRENDTLVTGDGPAGVPIELIDLSEIDLVLGKTVITKNGDFTFELDKPLKGNHIIGIKLGDISRTDLNENDFIYSESYFDRPYVGIIFDLVIVQWHSNFTQ